MILLKRNLFLLLLLFLLLSVGWLLLLELLDYGGGVVNGIRSRGG